MILYSMILFYELHSPFYQACTTAWSRGSTTSSKRTKASKAKLHGLVGVVQAYFEISTDTSFLVRRGLGRVRTTTGPRVASPPANRSTPGPTLNEKLLIRRLSATPWTSFRRLTLAPTSGRYRHSLRLFCRGLGRWRR